MKPVYHVISVIYDKSVQRHEKCHMKAVSYFTMKDI